MDPHRARLLGIGLICSALLCFSVLDTIAKYLGGQMDTLQVVWARYIWAFVLALVVANPIRRPQLMRTARPWLQMGRSTLLLLSTLLNFLALRHLQLDQTIAIAFATPFLVAVLSGPTLGEWVGPRRWAAILVGFCGVILVTRPGAGGIDPAALFSIGAVICYAFYAISTRMLALTEADETTLFYSNLVGAVVMSVIVPFVWTPPDGLITHLLMLVMGALGGFGHYLMIVAHRNAPAAVLAPFIYTQMVWMIALGYLTFGNTPNGWTLTGAAVVIASGLYLLHRERVTKGTE